MSKKKIFSFNISFPCLIKETHQMDFYFIPDKLLYNSFFFTIPNLRILIFLQFILSKILLNNTKKR